jgi:hypothetical protein
VLNLEWRESEGPAVKAPAHRGFGMQMLSRAVDQFGGTIETIFAPTGLVCKLSAEVGESTLQSPSNSPHQNLSGKEFTVSDRKSLDLNCDAGVRARPTQNVGKGCHA